MDLRIYSQYTPYLLGNLYLIHIQAYTLSMGLLDTLEDKYIFHFCIPHLNRMVKDYMDLVVLEHLLQIYTQIKYTLTKYINCSNNLTFLWFNVALCEWISYISINASASRIVRNDFTDSIEAARSWTRISTFFLNTCFITRTLWIYNAFWATIRRLPYIIR